MLVEIISGKAGTGKSWTLANRIHDVDQSGSRWVVLAFTHSAVKNIREYVQKNHPSVHTEDRFKTIHAFFHLNYHKTILPNIAWDTYDFIFIDEYSLVSKKLFVSILPMLTKHCKQLVLCGDYRQLRPVESSDTISYEALKRQIVAGNSLTESFIDALCQFDNLILSMDIVRKNVYDIHELATQHRANEETTKLIEQVCFSGITDNAMVTNRFIGLSTVIDLIKNEGYVFIASTYKQLEQINSMIKDVVIPVSRGQRKQLVKSFGDYVFIDNTAGTQSGLMKRGCGEQSGNVNRGIGRGFAHWHTLMQTVSAGGEQSGNENRGMNRCGEQCGGENRGIGRGGCGEQSGNVNRGMRSILMKKGDRLRVTETYDEFQNGDEYELIDAMHESLIVKPLDEENADSLIMKPLDGRLPVLPSYLITFHKAQGLSIENVIMCLDNIFEQPMMYTGLSRARKNLLFYTKEGINADAFSRVPVFYSDLDKLWNDFVASSSASLTV